MKKFLSIITIVFILFFFYSCGKKGNNQGETTQKESVKQEQKAGNTEVNKEVESNDTKETTEENKTVEKNPIAAMHQFAEKVKKASEEQQGGKITILNEDDFTKLLPKVSGWQLEGKPYYSKESFGSMTTSRIKAVYTNGDKRVTVEIKDSGTMSSLIAPMKMALSMHFDHEDSNGYERVFDYKGEKGVEKYNKNEKEGNITFLVKSKYIIELRSNKNVDMKELKTFLENIDISKLK